MANRYFTLMIIPEKTSKVRRLLIPSWLVRGALVLTGFAAVLGFIMMLDYGYVMNQIGENRELKLENRRLRQQVQVFNNKMRNVEDTMDRIRTFSTRLKIITNIQDRDDLVKRLNDPLPDADRAPDPLMAVPANPAGESDGIGTPPAPGAPVPDTEEPARRGRGKRKSAPPPETSGGDAFWNYIGIPAAEASTRPEPPVDYDERDPEIVQLTADRELLDDRFERLDHESLLLEQNLEDLYELLADQRAFLAALPTRRPAEGIWTSYFGVRKDPTFGARVKMHEGMDIANRIGTPIFATAYGVVRFAGVKAGYGQTVIVSHGYGLETWYGHASRLYVKKGDRVFRGDKLAAVGSSGRSTGPHVHYEVRVYGIAVDPTSYILEN
ncbi:MAG TPA: peptidoglycan DD-metalloendopeptidase family protein [Bdellovibrionota bacterium]|nr:peptidoglycan DD-metalloendopeptidase family protein [Bdellovibrionota bacterium]